MKNKKESSTEESNWISPILILTFLFGVGGIVLVIIISLDNPYDYDCMKNIASNICLERNLTFLEENFNSYSGVCCANRTYIDYRVYGYKFKDENVCLWFLPEEKEGCRK